MNGFCLWLCIVCVFSGLRLNGFQGDEHWDQRFFLPGLDGPVSAFATRSNVLFVGGVFKFAGGLQANGIAEWNGTRWDSLGGGIGGVFAPSVSAIAVGGSNVYVGGNFLIAGNVPCTNFARWDGMKWSPAGAGLNRYITAMTVRGDDVYVAGAFGFGDENPALGIRRWDGTNWFNIVSETNGYVQRMLFIGNDLFISGSFDRMGGVNATNVAKWNGAAWSPVAMGSNAPIAVWAIAMDGSTLHVAGSFQTATGIKNTIGKWDGSHWSSVPYGLDNFVPYLNPIQDLVVIGSDVYVKGAVLGNDLYAAGVLNHRYSIKENYLSRWDGTNWTEVGDTSAKGVKGSVLCVASSGRDIYIGGHFLLAGDVAATNIARWDGTNWNPIGDGIGDEFGTVTAIAIDGTRVLAGGDFGVAQWNGGTWTPMPGIGGYVTALAVSGTNIYANHLANFGADGAGIMTWTGTNWVGLGGGITESSGFELYYPVRAIGVRSNDVYITGTFTGVGGVAATNVAKWNGTNWSPLGNGLGMGSAIVLDEEYVYVAGGSLEAASPSLARWDGTNWFVLSQELPLVQLVATDGILYGIDGTDQPVLSRFNGTNWSSIASLIPYPRSYYENISALAVSGSDLLVGGSFMHIGDTASRAFAIWHIPQLLALFRDGADCTISWPTQAVDFALQFKTNISSGDWFDVQTTPERTNRQYRVRQAAMDAQRLFRLRRPY